jgi:hypothetical protein
VHLKSLNPPPFGFDEFICLASKVFSHIKGNASDILVYSIDFGVLNFSPNETNKISLFKFLIIVTK